MRSFHNDVRVWLGISLLIIVLSARVGGLAAAQPTQPDEQGTMPAPGTMPAAGTMPAGPGGAFYPYEIVPSDQQPAAAAQQLTIDVWFGDDQSFGSPGLPQRWANILGRVSGPRPITSLSYRLNGGPSLPLNRGGDRMRLWDTGDFNIELDAAALLPGPAVNTVVITAGDGVTSLSRTVTVRHEPGRAWPLPYVADWGEMTAVSEGGQVVDGNWAIRDGRLSNLAPGFDRLVAIGSMGWTYYEVEMPVIVHSINTAGWSGPSNGAGIGLIARWSGHYLLGNEQPRLGWRDLGALAWYHWNTDGTGAYEVRGDTGRLLTFSTRGAPRLNEAYIIKLRVDPPSQAGAAANYRFKMWPAAEAEPAAWLLQTQGVAGEPSSGSVVLVAHQVMASFGPVRIRPVAGPPTQPLRVTLSSSAGGTVGGGSLAYSNADLIAHEGGRNDWSRVVRAADVGIRKNVTGFAMAPTGEAVFALLAPQAFGQGTTAMTISAHDVLAYDPGSGTRRIYLRGRDVGLSSATERIDALAFSVDGRLVISTRGPARVPCAAAAPGCNGGTLLVQDEDLIAFLPSADHTGTVSRGTWEMVMDGSEVPGLARLNVNGASIDAATGTIYLSVLGSYRLGGVSGTARDIFSVRKTDSGYVVANAWAGRVAGLPGALDAIEVQPLR